MTLKNQNAKIKCKLGGDDMKDMASIDYFKKINMQYAYDSLTRTLNKEVILGYAKYLVEQNHPFTLFFLDLDNYKNVNDTLGHQVGDIVLEQTAKQIKSDLCDYGFVGRFGGDEFICIIEDTIDYDEVWKFAKKICNGIRHLKIEELKNKISIASITSTIGIARFPLDAKDFDNLLGASDKALYRGKHKGRNCFIIYNENLHANIKKTQEGKQYSSEQLLSYIYEELSPANDSLLSRMKRLTAFFYYYYNIDFIGIVENDKFLDVLTNEKIKNYQVIDKRLYDFIGLSHDGMITLNNRNHLVDISNDLYQDFSNQNIRATMVFECKIKNTNFGYLRIDMARDRVWTQEERLIFLTLARTYAIYKSMSIN